MSCTAAVLGIFSERLSFGWLFLWLLCGFVGPRNLYVCSIYCMVQLISKEKGCIVVCLPQRTIRNVCDPFFSNICATCVELVSLHFRAAVWVWGCGFLVVCLWFRALKMLKAPFPLTMLAAPANRRLLNNVLLCAKRLIQEFKDLVLRLRTYCSI